MQKTRDIATFKTYVDEGIQLKKEGNLASAIQKLSKALQLNPDYIPALNQLAEIYESRKEFDQAINYLQRLIKFQPDNGISHARLARAMMAQKNIQGAIASYQKAFALQPEQPEWVYRNLADALNQNGQIEEAIAAYQKAIEINPDISIVHVKLARAMMAQKNIQGAIASYQKAFALQPEQPEGVCRSLADALNQNGQIEEAIAAQALRIQNLKGKSLLHIGCNEGFFCNKARELGASRVVGIDKSKQAIEEAKKRFPDLDFRCQSWDILPEGKFDFILFLSDINYEKDQKSLFDRIRLALNRGGKLVLECGVIPRDDSRWVRVDRGDDSVLFPTQGMLERYLLKDFALRCCGRSVQQGGDPINRYVYQATPYQPILIIVAGESGSGKTVLTNKLSKNAEIFSLDNHIGMLIEYQKTDLANFSRTDFVGKVAQSDFVDDFVNSIFESLIISPITFVEGVALSFPRIRKAFELKAIEKGFVLWSMDRIKEVK